MKRILIITHYIAPLASIASVRWTKISKYLKKTHGDEVNITILTDKKKFKVAGDISSDGEPYDTMLAADIYNFDRIIEVPMPRITNAMYELRKRRKAQKKVENGIQQGAFQGVPSLVTRFYIEFRDYLLIHEAKKILMSHDLNGYDVIISSCGPLWTHGVAHAVKKNKPNIKWIADYRDMAVDEKEVYPLRWWHAVQSKGYTKNADLVIKVQDDLHTDAASYIPENVIPNGYDPDEMIAPTKPKKFDIVFTGSILDKKRADFSVIFSAIKDIVYEHGLNRDDFRVIYAGVSGNIAQEYAVQNGGDDVFVNKWHVQREEAIRLQRSAAILLQASVNMEKLHIFWSGKMYEYMSAQKPIIYIVNGNIPDSLPSRYIGKIGGYCYEACRHNELYEGMKQYLYEKYIEWIETGNVTVNQDEGYIESFSYENIAKRLWAMLL